MDCKVVDYGKDGRAVFDFSLVWSNDLFHLFYMQYNRMPDDDDPDERSVGHATSHDMISWQTEAPILRRGNAGSWDDFWPNDPVVTIKDGIFHGLYSGMSNRDKFKIMRVGLLTSPDLYHWERHPKNPILPVDPRFYESAIELDPMVIGSWRDPYEWYVKDFSIPIQGVCWRDPYPFYDKDSARYYALISARVNSGETARRGCIAIARSTDLLNWDVMPPLFSPNKYECMEVPQIFSNDGKYYLLYSTWLPLLGTHYAISNELLSGYKEPSNEWLLGGRELACEYMGRIVEVMGRILLLHWVFDREGGTDEGQFRHGRISSPKEVEFDSNGLLRLMYYKEMDGYLGDEVAHEPDSLERAEVEPASSRWVLRDGQTSCERLDGLSVLMLRGEGRNFVFSARLRLQQGRLAGLICRGESGGHAGYLVALDYEQQSVEFLDLPLLGRVRAKHVRLEQGQERTLKVVGKREFLEVYLDEEYMFSVSRYGRRSGRFGLAVDSANASFRDVRAVALKVE